MYYLCIIINWIHKHQKIPEKKKLYTKVFYENIISILWSKSKSNTIEIQMATPWLSYTPWPRATSWASCILLFQNFTVSLLKNQFDLCITQIYVSPLKTLNMFISKLWFCILWNLHSGEDMCLFQICMLNQIYKQILKNAWLADILELHVSISARNRYAFAYNGLHWLHYITSTFFVLFNICTFYRICAW